jgi:hypothetical protein
MPYRDIDSSTWGDINLMTYKPICYSCLETNTDIVEHSDKYTTKHIRSDRKSNRRDLLYWTLSQRGAKFALSEFVNHDTKALEVNSSSHLLHGMI